MLFRSGRSFALSSAQLPTHTQIAFGRDLDAAFVDYANYVYTTGPILASAAILTGLRSGASYQVYRDPMGFYDSLDPESTYRRGCSESWCNSLSFDRIGGAAYTWSFSPNHLSPARRGAAMAGALLADTSESYAWTFWVR